jgi:hypothetical protein
MICSKCNSNILDDWAYCPKCGQHFPSVKRGKRTSDVEFINKAFFNNVKDGIKKSEEKEPGEVNLKDIADDLQKFEISEDSKVTNWLWIVYPFFVFLLYFIKEGFDFRGSDIAYSIGRILGGVFFYILIPLLVIGIRRIFTKKQLSEKAKIILFYGASFAIFSLTMCSKILKNVKYY